MDRRSLLTAAVAGLFGTRLLPFAVAPALAQEPAAPFGFDAVVALARAAAAEAYARPLMEMAPPFADLRYDAFRAIRFREDRRLFADGSRAFQMELLPPGHHFQDRIEINLVAADGRVQPVAFSTDYFDFHPDYFPFPGRPRAGRPRRGDGLLGHALPLPAQSPRGLGRGRGVPGRELLPRRRPRHALRPVGARPRHRHRDARTRGVPDLQELLGARAAGRGRGAPPAGAARQRVGRRRLRLPHRARAGDRDADRGGPVPAPGDRLGRHRALDLDVLLRAGEPRRTSTTSATPCTTATASGSSTATASGSGGRSGTRGASRPRPSATRTRAPSV